MRSAASAVRAAACQATIRTGVKAERSHPSVCPSTFTRGALPERPSDSTFRSAAWQKGFLVLKFAVQRAVPAHSARGSRIGDQGLSGEPNI